MESGPGPRRPNVCHAQTLAAAQEQLAAQHARVKALYERFREKLEELKLREDKKDELEKQKAAESE